MCSQLYFQNISQSFQEQWSVYLDERCLANLVKDLLQIWSEKERGTPTIVLLQKREGK